MSEQNAAEKKPWWKSLWKSFVAFASVLLAVIAGFAAFSQNILSIRENFWKLFQPESLTVSVREARATEQPGGIIHIQFVLAREGHAQLTGMLKCEGTGLPPEGLMNGEYYSLASDYSDRLSEAGEMAMSMDLMPPVFGLSAPELLNFKLKCADLVTPWVPVKVKRLTE